MLGAGGGHIPLENVVPPLVISNIHVQLLSFWSFNVFKVSSPKWFLNLVFKLISMVQMVTRRIELK